MSLSGIWTHDHWIPFRRSNWLSYQAMSSTRSQSQLCTATPISSLCSVFTFHFSLCLRQSPHLLFFKRSLAQIYIYIYISNLTPAKCFLQVEAWIERNSNVNSTFKFQLILCFYSIDSFLSVRNGSSSIII